MLVNGAPDPYFAHILIADLAWHILRCDHIRLLEIRLEQNTFRWVSARKTKLQCILALTHQFHHCCKLTQSQGISSQLSGLILQGYSGLSTRKVREQSHDDIIKWKHYLHYWPFVWPLDSTYRGPASKADKARAKHSPFAKNPDLAIICERISGLTKILAKDFQLLGKK